LNSELIVIEDGAKALAFARQEGKAMRHSSHLSKVPVAITSTSASPHERAETERLGVERYMIKPPDLEGFFRLVRL
jgi:hypothetical protein